MNGLLVTAWLVIHSSTLIAIPYENMDQCEAVAKLTEAHYNITTPKVYCIPGNLGVRK